MEELKPKKRGRKPNTAKMDNDYLAKPKPKKRNLIGEGLEWVDAPEVSESDEGLYDEFFQDTDPIQLSVCIPVIAEHLPTLEKIGGTLGVWIKDCAVGINTFFNPVSNIEVLVMLTDRYDKGGPSRGLKRNELLKAAKGLYVVSVDADDVISDQYVETLLDAIEQGPDCIGFKIDCMINGKYFPAIASLRFADWTRGTTLGKSGAIERMPYHKTPIKREIALQVGFDERVDFGEDYIYSKGVKKLLKTEVFIDEVLYHYIK